MHSFDHGLSLKVRFRLEITTGAGERVAEYDVNRELPDMLGRHASPQAEKLILDLLDGEVLGGTRALVRARLARDQAEDPGHMARVWAPLGLRDGVDEALASLRACLHSRSG